VYLLVFHGHLNREREEKGKEERRQVKNNLRKSTAKNNMQFSLGQIANTLDKEKAKYKSIPIFSNWGIEGTA
jgi:hypothetical protein